MMKPLEKRSPGRPREFDRGTVLRAAMLVFWKRGYEGASLADLTEAMEISKPTLYAEFGDKQSLFSESVATYIALRSDDYANALAQPKVREVIAAWLRLTGGVREELDVPPGCLMVQGGLVGSEASRNIQEELASMRNAATKQMEKRFQQAKRQGDLPGTWQPAPLAQYVSALASGLAVQSLSGVSCRVLNDTVDQLVANLPASS